MVFCIFVRFPSFITIVFIFYLLVIFPSQTRIRVNIKVVRCLKYSASLVSTQSALRRNSDNTDGVSKSLRQKFLFSRERPLLAWGEYYISRQ